MKISSKIILALASIMISGNLFADIPCGAHTWHNVSTDNGVWNAHLQVINESEHAWLVGPNCSKLTSFTINSKDSGSFGLNFDNKADFDIAYTLTLTQQKDSVVVKANDLLRTMRSKACVFVVTAKGPARPDIYPISYNGAECHYKVIDDIGEDFYAN